MTNSEITKILNAHSLRATENRITILKCFTDNKHFHSIADIVKHNKLTLNTKSVYNTIDALLSHRVIQSFSFNGEQKYVFENRHNKSQFSTHVFYSGIDSVEHIILSPKLYDEIIKKSKLEKDKIKSIKIIIET